MAYQETAAEQLERYKTMPSFARDFRNKSLEQQTEVFVEFGIKHSIHKKMFEFLCIVIQDALQRTGRSFTTYKYYADAVLKWASNPNNLRSMPGFPRSEDTLKTNFEPLLSLLVEKGILIVGQDPQAGDERKTLSFAFENKIKSSAESQELDKVTSLLETEYAKIKAGSLLPLPTRRQVEKVLRRELAEKIRVLPFAPQKYSKRELANTNFSQADLIEMDFGNQYIVLVPPRYIEELREIGAARLVAVMQDIALVRQLDAGLANSFPGDKPPTITSLFSEKNGRFPAFEKNLPPWVTVIKRVLDEIREREGSTPAGRAKFYPIFLLYNWLIQEQKEEQRSAVEQRVFEALYLQLTKLKRAASADELRNTDFAQTYIKDHSVEEFDSLFERFVEAWSLQNNLVKPETIIQVKSGHLGTLHLQSKVAFDLFASWSIQEEKHIGELVEATYIKALAERRAGSEINQAMSSDDGFDAHFARTIHAAYENNADYQLFFSLLTFFSKSPAALTALSGRSGVAAGRFLMQAANGRLQMRPLPDLCGWSRPRILEEVERRIPFMRKLIVAIKALFGGGGKKSLQDGASKKRGSGSTGASEARSSTVLEQGRRGKDKGKTKIGQNPSVPDASAKARAVEKSLPKNLKPVTPDEQYEVLAKGKTKGQHLSIWNRQLGQAAEENKRIVDDIVAERLGPIKRKLKSGDKTVEIGLQAYYILNSPRLDGLQNKDSVFAYVGLSMLEALEEFRKTNRLSFTYLVKK